MKLDICPIVSSQNWIFLHQLPELAVKRRIFLTRELSFIFRAG